MRCFTGTTCRTLNSVISHWWILNIQSLCTIGEVFKCFKLKLKLCRLSKLAVFIALTPHIETAEWTNCFLNLGSCISTCSHLHVICYCYDFSWELAANFISWKHKNSFSNHGRRLVTEPEMLLPEMIKWELHNNSK